MISRLSINCHVTWKSKLQNGCLKKVAVGWTRFDWHFFGQWHLQSNSHSHHSCAFRTNLVNSLFIVIKYGIGIVDYDFSINLKFRIDETTIVVSIEWGATWCWRVRKNERQTYASSSWNRGGSRTSNWGFSNRKQCNKGMGEIHPDTLRVDDQAENTTGTCRNYCRTPTPMTQHGTTDTIYFILPRTTGRSKTSRPSWKLGELKELSAKRAAEQRRMDAQSIHPITGCSTWSWRDAMEWCTYKLGFR